MKACDVMQYKGHVTSHKFSQSLRWDNADLNGDGFVDGRDFLHWNANKFTSSDVASVPEPAALVLLLMATVLGCRALRS